MDAEEYKKQVISLAVRTLNEGKQFLHNIAVKESDPEKVKEIVRLQTLMQASAVHLAMHFDQSDEMKALFEEEKIK